MHESTMSIPADLLQAYQGSVYTLACANKRLAAITQPRTTERQRVERWLRLPIDHSPLDRHTPASRFGTWGEPWPLPAGHAGYWMTADNPRSRRLSDATNRRRRLALLRGLLRALRAQAVPLIAKPLKRLRIGHALDQAGSWPPEHGYWVIGLRPDLIKQLARRFDQHAVLEVRRRSAAGLTLTVRAMPASRLIARRHHEPVTRLD